MSGERATAPEVVLGRNQFHLLTNALEGMLTLIVEDWRADVPVAKDPWSGAGPLGKTRGTGEVWDAINQARGVLQAALIWVHADLYQSDDSGPAPDAEGVAR